MYNQFLRLISLVLLCAVLFCGCKEQSEPTVELLDPVEYIECTSVVTRKDVEVYHANTSAELHYRTEALYFKNGGYVGNSEVSIGDSVKKGDLILQLDLSDTKERYEQLSASLDQMKTEQAYERKQLELDHEIATLQLELAKEEGADEYELAKCSLAVDSAALALKQQKERSAAALSALELQLAETSEQIENSRIYAPFDGVVTYLPDTMTGKVYVTDAEPAAVIADFEQLSLRIDYMSEQKLSKYERFTASIQGKEYPLALLPQDENEILRAFQLGKPVYTEFEFTGELPQEIAGARVTLNMYYGSYQDVLTVPYAAVVDDAGSDAVYLQRDGKKYLQKVEVLEFNASEAIIASGLQEGDVVYVE